MAIGASPGCSQRVVALGRKVATRTSNGKSAWWMGARSLIASLSKDSGTSVARSTSDLDMSVTVSSTSRMSSAKVTVSPSVICMFASITLREEDV